jgi:hypothetical protein
MTGKLFTYLLPYGFSIPSYQTMQLNLDILYDSMNASINHELKVCHCTSNAYSSF